MTVLESNADEQRLAASRNELIERIMSVLPGYGVLEIFPGVFVARASSPTEHYHSVFKPAFCIIAQGTKQVMLGDEIFRYDPGHYLISTVDLPIVSHVSEASEDKPYLSVRVDLDPTLVASAMMESGVEAAKKDINIKAMDVSSIDADLLDAIVRLIRLVDSPDEMRILAPLVIKEIIYRLLKSEQGARLNHLIAGGDTRRISRALKQFRDYIDKPLRIEDMARDLGMSVSGFHHHFKSVTAMSPIQYQKQLRLQEARRLMLGEDMDVASAGFRVGYEDPSYFSREYKKLFGAPPQRDIAKLRQDMTAG